MSPGGSRASVARGLVLFAAILATVIAARALLRYVPGRADPPLAACPAPVEVAAGGAEARPACAGDPAVAACGELTAGDRVVLGPNGCARDRGGMRATWRLAYGLKIDVNRASEADLLLVERVGPRLASAIVAEREAHGPYGTLEDLARVRGIGPTLLAELAAQLEAGPRVADAPVDSPVGRAL